MHNRLAWGLSVGGFALFTGFRVAEITAMRVGENAVMAAPERGTAGSTELQLAYAGNVAYNKLFSASPPSLPAGGTTIRLTH